MKNVAIGAGLLLAAWAANASPAGPGQDGGNALALFNAWLITAAQSDPRWRTEIRADATAGALPAGRYRARSPVLGTFSYRPKTYAELRPEERLRLLRQPEFRRRLLRPPPRDRKLRFQISPEEMRQNRPFFFTVPPP